MLKIYYMMWSDIVLTARKNGNFTDKWKDLNLVLPVFQGFNLLAIGISFKFLFNINLPLAININFFSSVFLNKALSGILIFYLPFYLMNYFLIIKNDRYKKIIGIYKSYNGKILLYYVLISIICVFGLLILMKIM